MKNIYLAIIIVLCFGLTACKKEAVAPVTTKLSVVTHPSKPTVNQNPVTGTDTLADMSMIRLALVLDSNNYDETAFMFSKTANPAYDFNEDGKYMDGMGAESLASVAPDGTEMVIDELPYAPGKPIKLFVNASKSGTYSFKVTYERTLPANLQVWVKDRLTNDSLNVRSGNYKFNVLKADTNSYGGNRFQLILRAGTEAGG